MRSVLNVDAPADEAVDDVALVQQLLGQVGAVLPGDAREEGDLVRHAAEPRGTLPVETGTAESIVML